ncbi:polyamine ABC transporter substrate-binding protein [Craterilacuibacter sinensis]|uniref:Putrescine-binding periplasmic protein n=1 Tax=Craterilacuibacter sinensis TaxID=2686017 RepID=A0A845BM05_9NEIS|nr:polyamine ABC transporter substrate-binding protein [Craterilacuibacter sinensis]MXR37362.1 extracellular solute-binding protein [Craterilacuibacter sinensis]
MTVSKWCVSVLALVGSMATAQAESRLNVYNWADYIAEGTVPAFQKVTGIKVRYDVYDSNEMLRAKLMTGHTGYDIVVPTQYTVDMGIKAGMFEPLDRSKLPNWKHLDPQLLKLMEQFDPGNRYAVPYLWGLNTVGINVPKVKQALGGKLPDDPWDLVFKPEVVAKLKGCGVSVLDSAGVYFASALHWAGKNPNSNQVSDYEALMPTLKAARKSYRMFNSSSYTNELADGSVCVAMGYSGDLNTARKRAAEAGNGVQLMVLMPKSGLNIWVDSLTIPKGAVNQAQAHRFINAMLEPKTAAANANFVSYAPGVAAAKPYIDKVLVSEPVLFPPADALKGSFVTVALQPETIRSYTRLWQKLKAGK